MPKDLRTQRTTDDKAISHTVIRLLALGLENHNYNDSGFSFFVFAEFRARLSLRTKLGILIVGDL